MSRNLRAMPPASRRREVSHGDKLPARCTGNGPFGRAHDDVDIVGARLNLLQSAGEIKARSSARSRGAELARDIIAWSSHPGRRVVALAAASLRERDDEP